ncbi:[FeFe] hydrogenase H-cluster radical SAM maturase HydE [Slackia heliotrinireducens]|uniref:[FeFe] hydrogenase H-cluster radical SAM maturase HydE n=1 Tax=Slackia heliotrinireducens TaxID=84110 RepID=UPI0033150C26
MDPRSCELIEKLGETRCLELHEYEHLVSHMDAEVARFAAERALRVRKAVYGNGVFTRGLIEVSNFCKNDCLYCGIRRSNRSCHRYRLAVDQILACADVGYEVGFRTFVLQGGEDPWFTDERVCDCVRRLKQRHPDCAVTLSLGERSPESYQALREAGADRYLLRHETATPGHYARLHPADMSWDARMACLYSLREAGFTVGCGFMVGSPFQTPADLAADLKFIETFAPEMCGIGPFIPHHATPFAAEPAGTVDMTCFLLSLLRLMHPNLLLPATTALGTADPFGREKGMLAGANVVMPNLSPKDVRQDYELYDDKVSTGGESAEGLNELAERMVAIGFELLVDRGDPRPMK